MKLNLFGGVFIFEGTLAEFNKVYNDVDKLGTKLVGIQTQLNKETLETQHELTRNDPSVQIRHAPQRPAGLQ